MKKNIQKVDFFGLIFDNTNMKKSSLKAFIRGMAKSIDLGGTISVTSNRLKTQQCIRLDSAALKEDWIAIGNDLTKSFSSYKNFPHVPKAS